MNIRVQRLIRAQRLQLRATRPFTSTRFPRKSVDDEKLPETSAFESSPLESNPEANEVLDAGREALRVTPDQKELQREAEEGFETANEALRTADTEREVNELFQKEPGGVSSQPESLDLFQPTLGKGYVVGGHLQRNRHNLVKNDERGCPTWGPGGVSLLFKGWGGDNIIDLPNYWLRDNCRCSKCVNQDTMQRAFDTFSIDRNIMPEEVVTEKEGLRVKWNEEGHDHISLYPWEWIMKHGVDQAEPALSKAGKPKKTPHTFWGADIAEKPPSVPYGEIMADDKGVGALLAKIREYGFSYVDDAPVNPEQTKTLLERIAFIRQTHYGGFYDFTADLTMKDTAYTNLALPAHTDNTYFTDPSGLQAFHLLSHTEGSGGKSLLVDGFHAASVLKKEDPMAYNTLSNFPISWHASGNEGITITPSKKYPVLEHGDLVKGVVPEVMRIRWNNDDRGVVQLRENDSGGATKWYNAARHWNEILKRPEMEYWSQLKPGRPLIFDNWRVLHGRSAFTGKRRICGAYINRDDWISRWRNTNFTREEALKQIL